MRRVRLVRAPEESTGGPCAGQVEGLGKIEAHIEGSDLEQQVLASCKLQKTGLGAAKLQRDFLSSWSVQDKDAGQPYFSQPGLNPRQQVRSVAREECLEPLACSFKPFKPIFGAFACCLGNAESPKPLFNDHWAGQSDLTRHDRRVQRQEERASVDITACRVTCLDSTVSSVCQ